MDCLSSCANDSLRFLSRSFCREGRQQTIDRYVLCVLRGNCSISHSFCREGRQHTIHRHTCAVFSVWELLHLPGFSRLGQTLPPARILQMFSHGRRTCGSHCQHTSTFVPPSKKKKKSGSAILPRCGRNSMMKKRWSRAD